MAQRQEQPQIHDRHDLHDAAKPGSSRSWHVWLWSFLVIVGMVALVVIIQVR